MKFDCDRKYVGRAILCAVTLVFLVGAPAAVRADTPQTGCYKREALEPKVEAAIDEFRAAVPEMMENGNVPGAALALVDDQGIIWTEGFGHLGGKKKLPVTPDTPFMICGLSKLITATAVMLAVQDGLIKLDEPITTYLPDFQVNSRYEERPERKITLRHLLNCTAGLPIEVPLGNYFEPAAASFEDHVRSLYGSWLVCPVGSSFYLSDASFDLAAYTVGVVAGKPFPDYLRDRLLRPLGMSHTTADRQEILDNSDRAIGHMMGLAQVPAAYPGLGAIGLYSTARDMARFLQLHINWGAWDRQSGSPNANFRVWEPHPDWPEIVNLPIGPLSDADQEIGVPERRSRRPLVERPLIETIHAPVGVCSTEPKVYYGQGVRLDQRAPENTETLLWHDGLGFGFQSLLHWYPEYGLGMVVLTNRLPHPALTDLGLTLTDKLIKDRLIAKRLPGPALDCTDVIGAWWGWSDHRPTPFQAEWGRYCGTHNLRFNEYKLEWWAHLAVIIRGRDEYTPRITVREKDGFLCVTESKFFEMLNVFRSVDERLQEVRPGVFTTKGGGTLDFTREIPTWCNYRLEKH